MNNLNVIEKYTGNDKSLLLIETPGICSNSLKPYLQSECYNVNQVVVLNDIKSCIVKYKPELVVVNIELASISAIRVCQILREIFNGPIMVLTTDESEYSQIEAFNVGVNDYLVKPISPNLLKVRLKALSRWPSIQAPHSIVEKIQVGDIALYPLAQQCQVKNQTVKLSTFEFRLLGLLLTNVGKIMSRDSIYNLLLGRNYNGEERTVDVRVSKLRDKLASVGAQCAKIETVWGQGYMLNEIPSPVN